MQAYIAMPEAQALEVDVAKNMTCASLSLPRNLNYLPLKDTNELAVDAAISGHAMLLPMATDVTVWYILEITVPEQTAFKMVQDGLLVRDLGRGGWRLFGNLDFSAFAHQWYKASLPPMGVEAWSEKTLMPRFRVRINSVCCICHKSGPVWRNYCAGCWIQFCMDTQTKVDDKD